MTNIGKAQSPIVPNVEIEPKKVKDSTQKANTVDIPNALKSDSIKFSDLKKGAKAEKIDIFGSDKPNDKSNESGWKIKSVHFNAGYMFDNKVIHNGPMHIVNEKYDTDVTMTGYKQKERTNFKNLTMEDGTRFAPDEPQFNMGVNMTFNNNFGIELDAKHNKIIMAGYDQEVHYKGKINGVAIDQDAPMNTFMAQHEHTFGNMQINALATYNLDLPAPANHKFSVIAKAGPSVITTASHSWLKNPSGDWDHGETKVGVTGFGGMVEGGLRYQFGPKVGRAGLELTHSISYLNYAKYPMEGGYTGSHTAVNSAFSLKATVGLYGNKK